MIHSRVSWMLRPVRQVHDRVRAPADRPHHLVDLGGDVAGDRAIADVGVDLDEEIAPDRHRLALGVVDVVGDDRAPARHFVANELGRDEIGDRSAEILAVANMADDRLAAEILAVRDIFHLGRDDAAAGVMHLADVMARPWREARGGGRWGRARLRPNGRDQAGHYPRAGRRAAATSSTSSRPRIQSRRSSAQPGIDVDLDVRIGVRPAGVVEVERRLARRRLEVDRAHRHLQRPDVDLAAAPDRPGGDARLAAGGEWGFGAVQGCRPWSSSPIFGERQCSPVADWLRLPSLRRCQPDQVRRVAVVNCLSAAIGSPGMGDV